MAPTGHRSSGHLPLPHNNISQEAIRYLNTPDSEGSNRNSGLQARGIIDGSDIGYVVVAAAAAADPLGDGSLGNGAAAADEAAVEPLAENNELEVLEFTERPSLYSDVRVWSVEEGASLGPQNRFYLDLAGPKLALCAGPLIDSLLKLQAEHHVKFMAVESSYIWRIILYAIALADEDQELVPHARRLITAKEGFAGLALYLASVSRFPTAPGPFLYPMYGQGDLTQAFCRCAAVHGALQVLRMQVRGFLVDKETKDYRGIKTVSGQNLYSGKLITGPSFCMGSLSPTSAEDRGSEEETARCRSSEHASTSTQSSSNRNMPPYKVACRICITDQSLQPGVSTLLVIFPPRSLSVRTTLVVRALQLGSRSEICPDGKFVMQLSTVCSNSTAGDEALQAAASALFHCENRESDVTDSNRKPKLWSLFMSRPRLLPGKGQETRGPAVCRMGLWTTEL